MNRIKDKARIHANLALMGLFSIGFFITALQGKRHWREGRGITDMNLDWHKKYQETGVMGDIREIPEDDVKKH